MDRMDEVVPDLIPPEYQDDEEILRLYNRNTPLTAIIPLCCRNSMMTLGRPILFGACPRTRRSAKRRPRPFSVFQSLIGKIQAQPPAGHAGKGGGVF